MVDGTLGEDDGFRDALEGTARQVGGQGAEEILEIGPAAVHVVGVQAAGQGLGQAGPGGLAFVQPDMGRLEAGQGGGQAGLDEVPQVVPRGIEKDGAVVLEQAGIHVRG